MRWSLWLLLAGCGGGAVFSGEQVYRQPLPEGNTFSCSTCHALTEPEDVRRAGHPIGDATRRPSWKNGQAKSFLEAVNSCVTEWLAAPAWAADEPRFLALKEFLEQGAPPGPAPALRYQIKAPPTDLSGADRARGEALFNASCSVCHGRDGRGAPQGPNLAGARLDPSYVANRIRHSGPTGSSYYPALTGGRMPFWAADRLSDGELKDVVAFVSSAPVPDGGLFVPDAGQGPTGGDCPKTHSKIGWYADLATYAHGVRGRATVTDDCTVTLSSFSYDGNGIDVRLFGARAKNFASGFPIGGQLYRPGQPYLDATLPMRLPAGKTLDDFDSVSVWCVAARHNFGDGVLRAP